MATLRDILYVHLCNLSNHDFKRFRDKLSDFYYGGNAPICRGNLDNADAICTKNLLMDAYGEDALEVAIQVLQCIGLGGCAEKLKEDVGTNKAKEAQSLEDCRVKYLKCMKEKYERIEDRNARLGESVNLESRYTSLLMIQKDRNEKEREREIISTGRKHQEVMATRATDDYCPTTIQTLFYPDQVGKIPSIVVLQGPAGIGKTMMVQKIMFDWASGNLYRDAFDFVFCVSCREVNNISVVMSLTDFISKICELTCSENTMKSIMGNSRKILVIIDGFDELKWQPQKEMCVDPFQKTSMEVLLNSILRKRVLRDALLLVTTRPYTLERFKECETSLRYVEVMGFTGPDRRKYFYNFFEEKGRADVVLKVITGNETLFTLCCVPIMCWIICTVMKQQMEKGLNMMDYKTTTSVYTLYIKSLVKYHGSQSGQSVLSCVKKLSTLAKDGVWEQKILFTEKDLEKYGLTVSKINSTFLNENIFQRDIEAYTSYSFIHLSIQEFFAALYYILHETIQSSNHVEATITDKEVMFLVDRSKTSPHLKSTVQFLFGLSAENQKTEIEKVLGPAKGMKHTLEMCLRKISSEQATFYSHVDVVNCFYETQDENFVRRMMENFLKLEFFGIIGTDLTYSAISYCLRNSPRKDHTLEFLMCYMNRKSLETLAPVLFKCTSLLIRACNVTSEFLEDLGYVIVQNRSLINLDLCDNNLQDSEVKHLCDALRNPGSNLKALGLRDFGLTSACCEDLRDIIITNRSLVKLNLGYNKLGDSGVKLLCDGLKHPNCSLQELSLRACDMTSSCCEDLHKVIVTNRSLIKLDLALNYLGVKRLFDALKHPDCTLQELGLDLKWINVNKYRKQGGQNRMSCC